MKEELIHLNICEMLLVQGRCDIILINSYGMGSRGVLVASVVT